MARNQITINLPSDLQMLIKRTNFDVEQIATDAIKERLAEFTFIDTLSSMSHLTEKNVLEFGEMIKKITWQKHYRAKRK